jgi:SAM-dependent methyltransferase
MPQPYLSLEAELHDWFWAAEDDGSEVRLMKDFLRSKPGMSLEMGCGSGRLLLPLVAQGFPLEGLELSPDMLKLCRSRAAQDRLEPVLHCGDMASWSGGQSYQNVLAPAFTLQLASDPAAVLRHWHGLLATGGGLYLTTFLPLAELEGDLPEAQWYADHQAVLPDGTKALLETRHRIDRQASLLVREHRYTLLTSPPRRYRSSQTLRWFTPAELGNLLVGAGFSVETMFGDFHPTAISPELEDPEFEGILTCHARRIP